MKKFLASTMMIGALALVSPFPAYAQYYSSYPNNYSYSNYQMPQMYWCGTYYSYSPCTGSGYTQHNFSPYTYINTSPYVNVSAPYSYPGSYSYPSYSYSYPMYSSPYAQGYGGTQYSYPSYSYSYPTYMYPTYYYDYGYNSYNSYDGYCYSGYGCYPMYVADPHQWLYDPWTGSWY